MRYAGVFTLLIMTACSGDDGGNVPQADTGVELPVNNDAKPGEDVVTPGDNKTGDGRTQPETDSAGCIPKTCGELDLQCGTHEDGCGGLTDCGDCSGGKFCHADGSCNAEPDCSAGYFDVADVSIADQGYAASAVAGTTLPIIFKWHLGNAADCQTCRRQVVVGVEDDPGVCVDAGTPPLCPAFDTGMDPGYVKVPDVPGTYKIYAFAPAEDNCAAAGSAFSAGEGKKLIGTLYVDPACGASTCGDLNKECGAWDDGCNGLLFCGDCGAGLFCNQDGGCETAGSCSLDVFEITSVYIKGFLNTVTVSPGETVPVLFSWSLGNGLWCDDCPRQIVVGVENFEEFCIDVGVPDSCPGYTSGVGNGYVTAPATAGAYTVYAAAANVEDCTELENENYVTAPKIAIGTLQVLGDCTPGTCASLNVQCGFNDDGCGGVTGCGECPGAKFCTAGGTCSQNPDCDAGIFEMVTVKMGASGNSATAVPGEKVPVVLDWKLGNSQACPHCARQIVAGIEGSPSFCIDAGVAPACPEFNDSLGGGYVSAPAITGTFALQVAALAEPDCPKALVAYKSSAAKQAVGTLAVVGSCTPATCEALSKECGDWGDGCGGMVHCGVCPEGKTCNNKGKCVGECTEGIFETYDININGSGETASAGANMNIPITVGWNIGNSDDCPDCKRQLVLGIDDIAGPCIDLGTPDACPGYSSGVNGGSMSAPASSGNYTVYALAAAEGSCVEAAATWEGSFEKKALGTLHVPSGCVPKNCNTLGKDCGNWDDGCSFALACGECAAGDICNSSGDCYCSASDDYEPNNTPGSAHFLGSFSDHDAVSTHTIVAAVHNEQDWFEMDSNDEAWAYMEPYVHVEFGLEKAFEVYVVYVCDDLSLPDFTPVASDGCAWTGAIGMAGVEGVGGTVSGYKCTSQGDPVSVQFGPKCGFLDDSGTLYVGVKGTGACSGYTLDLHL